MILQSDCTLKETSFHIMSFLQSIKANTIDSVSHQTQVYTRRRLITAAVRLFAIELLTNIILCSLF